MEIAIVFLMLAMGLGLVTGQTPDYCNVTTCTATSGKTVLCGNADLSTWGPTCVNHSDSSAFLPEDQQFIVNLHNQLRRDIALGKVKNQPAASNMRKMQWDDELAKMAQANVQRCSGSTKYTCSDVGRFPVGQNVYYWEHYNTSGNQLPPAVKDLFKRSFDRYGTGWTYGINIIKQDIIDDIRNIAKMSDIDKVILKDYITLASAKTYLVGCAGAYYSIPQPEKLVLYITCNYGPGIGTTGSVYKRGEAGSACPAGTKKEADTGLCAALPGVTLDYCKVATCTGKTALCSNADISSWDANCGKLHPDSSAIIPDEQQSIVDLHNKIRSEIAKGKVKDQPAASNMRKMKWDDELAQMAQANAQKCYSNLMNPCRDVDRFKVGQNFLLISIAYQKQPTAKDLFLFLFNNYGDKWTSGMKLISTAYIDDIRSTSKASASNQPVLKTYINLVSAETYLVGCAVAYYGSFQQRNAMVTCNYGPSVMGTTGSVYTRGEAGSACPAGTTKEADTGLCA